MPVVVNWNDEAHTIILTTITDPWGWDELFAAGQQVRAMLDASAHPVALINDFTQTHTLPPQPIIKLRQLADHLPADTEVTFMVGVRTLLGEIAVDTYSRVFSRLQMVPTVAEALDQLAARRDTA